MSPAAVRDDDNSVKSDESEENFFLVFINAKSSSDSTIHDEVRKYLEDSDNNLPSLKAFPIVPISSTTPHCPPVLQWSVFLVMEAIF